MNKKITFPELVEAVAATTETSKRTSEMFLKELFFIISDSLSKGENVRIRNLGQFKLTEVGERKSVNVNTGAEMKIPSHTKVSFIPDKTLADAINLPFANFETIELSDNITEEELKIMTSVSTLDLDEESQDPETSQADDSVAESIDIDNEVETKPSNEEECLDDEVQAFVTPDAIEPEIQQNAEVEPENAEADDEDTLETDNDKPIEEFDSEDAHEINGFVAPDVAETGEHHFNEEEVEPETTSKDTEPVKSADKKEKRKNTEDEDWNNKSLDELRRQLNEKYTSPYKSTLFFRGYFWGVVTMLLISAVAFYSYYLYTEENSSYEEAINLATNKYADKGNVVTHSEDSITQAPAPIDSVKPVVSEAQTAEPELPKQNVIRYDTVSRNRFLTTMSRAYYGDFRFWVYIYEENKSKITDPNAIPPGTVVIIPSASKYGIDKNDPKSVKKAELKATEIFSSH